MENDDKPIGQILSRRDALKLLGPGSAAFLRLVLLPRGQALWLPLSEQHRLRLLQVQLWTVLCVLS
jgi:hypothetical protein